MKGQNRLKNMALLNEEKGLALVLVLSFVALMVLSTVSLSQILERDARLLYRAKWQQQARHMAEAGLHHAFAHIMVNGYESLGNDLTYTIQKSLDTGSYDVKFSSSLGRDIVTSKGTVGNASATVTAEITGTTGASALYYFSSAGTDITIFLHPVAAVAAQDSYITGDIHANNDMSIRVHRHARLDITGRVSATGLITQGNQRNKSDVFDAGLYINGLNNEGAEVFEGEPRIIFPKFDYAKYKEAAEAGGSYHSGDLTLSGGSFSPSGGVVYVDGDAIVTGDTVIYGGLIADSITIRDGARLEQRKQGDRNVVIAKDTDIRIQNAYLEVEEAVVMAERDIYTHEHWGEVRIKGSMMAKRNLEFHVAKASIYYEHVLLHPPNLTEGAPGDTFRVLSFND